MKAGSSWRGSVDSLADLVTGYVEGELKLPRGGDELAGLERRLGFLRGHLARLAALPRDDVNVRVIGDYVVALASRRLRRCIDRIIRSLLGVNIITGGFSATLTELGVLESAVSNARYGIYWETCRDGGEGEVLGAVLGVDWDSGLAFVHPLPEPQAAVLASAEMLDEFLVRAAMGFTFHRWEPGAGLPVDGVRVRLQGDLAVEYAALFNNAGEALEAAETYRLLDESVRLGIEEARRSFERLRMKLAMRLDHVGSLGREWVEAAVEALLSGAEALRAFRAVVWRPFISEDSEGGRGAARPWGTRRRGLGLVDDVDEQYIVEFRVDYGKAFPGDKSCSMMEWRGLASPRCALVAILAKGGVNVLDPRLSGFLLNSSIPTLWGSRTARALITFTGLMGREEEFIAAAYAAELLGRERASRVRGSMRPRRVALNIGGHRIVAEEAVVVESEAAVLARNVFRLSSLLERLLEEGSVVRAIGGRWNPSRDGLSRRAAMTVLEALSLDVPSHVIVLTRPQRLVAEHPEHGRASLYVDAPAALLPGGLKSAGVATQT